MSIKKKSDKKVTNCKKETNEPLDDAQNLANSDKDLTFLVEMQPDHKEFNLRFEVAKDCKTKEKCSRILSNFPTQRHMKIAHMAGMGHNILYSELVKLCQSCQNYIYQSYSEKIGTCSNEGPEVFLAEVLESNTNEDYKNAYMYLAKLIDNPNAEQKEIDSYIEHYHKLKRKWNDANRIWKELLNEAAARHMGFDVDAGLPKKELKI